MMDVWVPPTSPIFHLIRSDYLKGVLFKEFFKEISVSEFDREEKPVVWLSNESNDTPQNLKAYFYISSRKGECSINSSYLS